MEYTFTLKYRLLPADQNADDLIERLGAEGCDDALVGVGQPCPVALEFTREANSAKDALQSALADVKRAMPAAQVNLVKQAEQISPASEKQLRLLVA